MNLQRIKHMLLRLSMEEKMLGIGALIIIISSFLPWYSVILSYNERMTTESGFTGDLGVIGFVVFILVVIAMAFLVSEYLHFRMPKFGFRKERILLFLMGESAFLLLLTIAIYTKRSIEYTNAGLRFGIYLGIIGAFIGVFAAYSQNQKISKKEVQEFFGTDMGDSGSSPSDEPSPEPETPKMKEEKPIKQHTPKSEQKSFFHEDVKQEDKKEEQAYFENEESDEMAEEIQEVQEVQVEPEADDTVDDEVIREIESSEKIPEDLDKFLEGDKSENMDGQSNYFMKEAGIVKKPGIKVDMESVKIIEKTPAKEPVSEKSANENMSFYDDL